MESYGHVQVIARESAPSFSTSRCGQARLDQAIVACALERCHFANGSYPASLDALVPRFLNRVPLDVCDGKPMKYRLQPDGQFVL
jgi:hypothetical protein